MKLHGIEEYSSVVNEATVNEATVRGKADSKFIGTLQNAVELAIQVNKEAKKAGGDWNGSKSQDVGPLLIKIYNAYSTGNPKDNEYQDEYFK